jgi:hypothetical protein
MAMGVSALEPERVGAQLESTGMPAAVGLLPSDGVADLHVSIIVAVPLLGVRTFPIGTAETIRKNPQTDGGSAPMAFKTNRARIGSWKFMRKESP